MPPTKLIGHIFAMGVWYIMLPPFFCCCVVCSIVLGYKDVYSHFQEWEERESVYCDTMPCCDFPQKMLHYDEELKINYDY